MKKFIISSDALKAALKKLSLAVGSNSTLPILSNLLCKVRENEVQLITTDMELTILFTVPCEAKDAFETLIPFDFLKKVVDLSPDHPMVIASNGRAARLTCINDSYDLNSLDKVKDFVNLPEVPKENFVSLNGKFIFWLGRAQRTCSKDEKDTRVNKICLDIISNALTMASTDKTMIFTRRFPVESQAEDQLLISSKIAKALEGFDTTEIYWDKQHILFKSGHIEIIATRHEEKFVNYQAVFPQVEPSLLLNRNDLTKALARACLNTEGLKHTVMHLQQSPGTVHMETVDTNQDRKIQVDIPGTYSGQLERISVNAAKLLTLMDQVDYDDVRLHISEATKPIVITAATDEDYKALIVPLTETT
jgi:DNA polymerase III sliding clamp (beta) subunit (PCNA family)